MAQRNTDKRGTASKCVASSVQSLHADSGGMAEATSGQGFSFHLLCALFFGFCAHEAASAEGLGYQRPSVGVGTGFQPKVACQRSEAQERSQSGNARVERRTARVKERFKVGRWIA